MDKKRNEPNRQDRIESCSKGGTWLEQNIYIGPLCLPFSGECLFSLVVPNTILLEHISSERIGRYKSDIVASPEDFQGEDNSTVAKT